MKLIMKISKILTVTIALFTIDMTSFAQTDRPLTLEELKLKLQTESDKGTCLSTLPLARQIYQQDATELKALQTIAECSQGEQNINRYASQTKEVFEQSRILSIVPKLLEMAQVKDLVPILREVEVKKDKSISDYLMINEIYERLGDPEKQIAALQEAIKIAPNDPRPLLMLASKQFDSGQRDQAEGLFKSYISQSTQQPGKIYLIAYVLSLAYPLATSLGLVGLIWLLSLTLAYRKTAAFSDWQEFRLGVPLFIFLVPPILAFRFWLTGKALPVGALLLILAVQIFFLFDPILSKIYKPVFKLIGKIIYFVGNGTLLAKKLSSLTTGSRVLISFTTLVLLGAITPTIDNPDLKYSLIVFSSLILYATIGSLMVSFLHSRKTLVVSLRWIGIAATFPFLISYIVSNWSSLGAPLMIGELPSAKAIDSLISYLVFWGVSFFLALHLGKIIAQAFIQPLAEIIEKVSLIEKGQFDAKVKIFSKDEIGELGHAINRMGSGLGKREKIEKTFRKYVDAQIAQRILDGVETELRIEGQNVDAVVLFADIRGFTTLSEKSEPQDIVKLLNQFFERMVKVIQKHDGVIDKFIGDNLMVVWGVPRPIQDAETKAVKAAIEMIEEVKKWNEELKSQGYAEIGVGIGINTGKVVAGSIGSTDRMEYTVIGDTVNTAQRAESIAKRQQIVVTDHIYEKLESKLIASAMEPVKVKGKEELQHWWSVTGLKTQEKQTAA